MSLQLSNLFQNQNSTSGVNTGVSGTGTRVPVDGVQPGPGGATVGGKPLSDFAPGSSLTGQVVSTGNGTVTIQLADSSLISASLKAGISLNAGSQVTFLVNSNYNNQMVLSPLFTNLSQSPNVENALRAAELPLNPQTAGMVEVMMEQGMSIDKNSLLAMYRQVAGNPGIDSKTVVKLAQMDLAVNELNAGQLEAYENLNHQLSGSIGEIADGLQQVFANAQSGNMDSLLQLFDGITQLLQSGENAVSQAALNGAGAADGNGIAAGNPAPGQGADGPLLQEILDEKSLQELSGLLKQVGAGEALAELTAKGEIPAKEVLQNINQLLQDHAGAKAETAQNPAAGAEAAQDNGALWKELLSGPAMGRLLKEVLQRNWMMEPKDVADKEKVDAFFEQLKSQTGKLASFTASVLGKDAVLTQSTNRLAQNIDFLNQLNQTFTYVQIPLKMNGQNANGDLYVYTNKKNLAAKDGNVSAFLHLDMDHLGSVDVYVTMEKQKVSTNFKVRDDSVLDLIEEHIDWLNERLQKRGYLLHATVEKQEEETSVLHEMQKQMGQPALPIAQVSFDARA